MNKLICNFGEFEAKKNNITNFINNYFTLLKELEVLENDTTYAWKSDSQKIYYSKFMERKAELEQLHIYYQELIEFLNNVLEKYKNIEQKYS